MKFKAWLMSALLVAMFVMSAWGKIPAWLVSIWVFCSQQGIVLQHPAVRHDIHGSLAMPVSQHVSATPSAIALMLGTTYSSINPAGCQTNQEVQEPGNYAFTDFVKLGLPLPLLLD
jgi:hypothetical protein